MSLAWSCTKYEAKQRCTPQEFAEWVAYDQLEPFGEVRADHRMAILATVVASGFGAKNVKTSDFMPRFDHPVQTKQTDAQLAARFRQYAELHNRSGKR